MLKRNTFYKLLGLIVSLPFFFMISSGGVSLPENHYEANGFPFHLALITPLIFLKNTNLTRLDLKVLLIILVVFSVSIIDFSRLQLVIQIILFPLYFLIFKSIPSEIFRSFASGLIIGISLFIFFHLLGFLLTFEGASDLIAMEKQASIASFFYQPIYQSMLTYPSVIIISLMIFRMIFLSETIDNQLPIKKINYYVYWLMLGLVIILSFLLQRRIAIGFLFTYLLVFHPRLSFFTSALIILTLMYLGMLFILEPLFTRFAAAFDPYSQYGGFLRSNTMMESLQILSNEYFFFFGNGINNYSHNLFLQLLTTNGIFIGLTMFVLYLGIVGSSLFKDRRFSLYSVVFAVFVIADWNLNVNILQPYYILFVTVFLVSHKHHMDALINSEKKLL